jgi:hypothetical protein
MADVFVVDKYALDVPNYTIEERCGQHDLLTVTGAGAAGLYNYAGKPASLSIDSGSNSRVIVGYLDTAVTTTGQKDQSVVTAFMLGASSALRSGSERKWKDKRPFEIASDVVRPYGFCLEMDTYKFSIPLFVQSAESDWQLLNRLADEIGMQLIGTNTVIRMIDPIMEIRRRKLRPLFTLDVTKLISYSSAHNSIPLGFEARVFSGIDKFGQTFRVVANEGASITLPAAETVSSLEEALLAKERIERRRHRMRRAQCVLKFNPILRSGTTIALTNGTETNVWFITESQHMMAARGDSKTMLSLYRDEDDQKAVIDAWRQSMWPRPVKSQDHWVGTERWEREL